MRTIIAFACLAAILIAANSAYGGEFSNSPFGTTTINVNENAPGEFFVDLEYSPVVAGNYSALVRLPDGLILLPNQELLSSTAADSGQVVGAGWTTTVAADGYDMSNYKPAANGVTQ